MMVTPQPWRVASENDDAGHDQPHRQQPQRARAFAEEQDAQGEGADRTDADPDGVGRAEGRVFMETASRPKLRIMNSRVTRLGHRRVKPADSFMAVAQTISKTPASKR